MSVEAEFIKHPIKLSVNSHKKYDEYERLFRGTKPMIIQNAAQCLKCGDVISSSHRHHFATCRCGAISVDGGKDYIRRAFENESLINDLVIELDNCTDFDKYVWGSYGKEGNQPLTYFLISELEISHLQAIVETMSRSASPFTFAAVLFWLREKTK